MDGVVGRAVLTATGIEISVNEGTTVVEPTNLVLREGEIFGLVGESGSGKTTLGLALMGYTRRGLTLVGGKVDITALPTAAATKTQRISYVPQNPGTALNPALTLRLQLAEVLPPEARRISPACEQDLLVQLLRDVKLPTDAAFMDQYPHQLSGGQQQRICIAMAFAGRPSVVVMDEPTTGLDVTTQTHILDMVRQLCVRHNAAVLYISHDLAVVSGLCARVAVMRNGGIVEIGNSDDVLGAPQHSYTRQLILSVPEFDARRDASALAARPAVSPPPPAARLALSVTSLSAAHGHFRVINDVALAVPAGECVALVGESGSGKTTLARCIAGLHMPSAGQVSLYGSLLAPLARERTADQRRQIQYIFQNPYTAFNPRRTIGGSLLAALRVFNDGARSRDRQAIRDALSQVALDDGFLERYPQQLSGGQRQRVAIARALLGNPQLLICDEITSALDVSVQAVIIDLLEKLRADRNLTLLFVTHNMALVRNFAQKVAVMHRGTIVDYGSVERVFRAPQADETRRLIRDTPHFVAPAQLKLVPAGLG